MPNLMWRPFEKISSLLSLGFFRRHWAIVLPAFVYLYIFPYLPALRSPNELCRLLQSRAIIDHGTIEIGDELREHGWIGDLSCVAAARDAQGRVTARLPCPQARGNPQFKEERYFPSKAPLLAFAAAPVYGVLKLVHGDVPEFALLYFARIACLIIPSLVLLLLVRRYLTTVVGLEIANLVTAIYATGTLAFSYSQQFVSHQSTAVLAFACFYCLWRLRRGEWRVRGYALAGLLGGSIVAAEYTGALALLPLGVYGMLTVHGGRRRGSLVLLSFAGLAVPVAALAAYHQAAFASPLATGYRYLNDLGYQGWHQGGFLGVHLPKARAFFQSFFSPSRGLFTLSPVLLLSLPILLNPRFLRQKDPDIWLSLATLSLYAYFTSSFAYESWGWTTGPRHLTSLIPFLLLPLALSFESLRDGEGGWLRLLRASFTLAAVALSIAVTSVMTMLNYISDTFTNPLYQVALPLALHGFLPHSVLSLMGLSNPGAALPAIGVLVAVLVLCALTVLRIGLKGQRSAALVGAALVSVLVGFLHASVKPAVARVQREHQAEEFMKNAYVPRPKQPPMGLWSK
jgi:hypothetical protein